MKYFDKLLDGYNAPLVYSIGDVSFECYTKEGTDPIYVKDNFFVKKLSPNERKWGRRHLTYKAMTDSPYYFAETEPRSIGKEANFGLFSVEKERSFSIPFLGQFYTGIKMKGISSGIIYQDNKDVCDFGNVYIKDDSRKKGLAQMLCYGPLKWALENGANIAEAHICEKNPRASHLVSKNGFILNPDRTEPARWGLIKDVAYMECYELNLNAYQCSVLGSRPE